MANRNFPSGGKIYSGHVMPVLLDCNFSIGASGAVSNIKGPFISSITRLGVGAYQIKLQDNYNLFYGGTAQFSAAVTGSAIDPNAGNVGQAYIITTLGNTDWTTAGVPKGVTPALGLGIVLAAQPIAGTGRVKAIASAGIHSVELIGNQNLSMAPDPLSSQGAIILVQCYGPTDATHTALIPADPANGSQMQLCLYLSNSSILINGE